ncbi:hypothetical protein [Novosphingobium gossypii]|uniref:hypothetical protein n=1 Tax=Novosphingobium gossypii TaxID=1604774 RepID=UPI003D1D5A8E
MKRWAMAGSALAAAVTWPVAAGASGDYGCSPRWSLAVSSYQCAGSALIGPRNDTRVNLAFLLRSQAGTSVPEGLSYPAHDWGNGDFGHVFVDWDVLQSAFWPSPATAGADAEDQDQAYAGSRCQTLGSGAQAFRTALAAAKGLTSEDRAVLDAARDLVKPACDGDKGSAAWPTVSSSAAQAWLGYLQGARAFYADDFTLARTRFADLARGKDPWLAQTARYMIARNELAAAQAGAFDEWGGYAGGDKVDRPSAERARAALQDYLSAYPRGLYAASASGLTRRAAWLLGDNTALTASYGGLIAAPLRSPAVLEEIESKVFFGTGTGNAPDAALLVATWDLLRMRQQAQDSYVLNTPPPALTAQDLASQAPTFSRQPDLYGFLKASFAFHVARDYRSVLGLIPDDARARRFTPLAFSRQMLRGLALEKLDDPNAAGFFQQMLGGARDLYQRPAVELALARHWEHGGQMEKAFATGSPITEPEIRTILLARVAGADLLRRQWNATAVDRTEREIAGFTLLAKNLSRGRYAAFTSDVAKVPADADTSGWAGDGWSSSWLAPSGDSRPPLGVFRRGKWQEVYACPDLATTASRLAADPRAVNAQLCLAEFWRLNGFDDYLGASDRRQDDQLGASRDQFAGTPAPRSALYAAVLANPSASADDTAYALYRSIQCYAPSRINACGGKAVPEAQRKAWFQRLKRSYPQNRWATSLKYYW